MSAQSKIFRPKEILFSPTVNCNLSCPHCSGVKSKKILPENTAVKFLRKCKKIGVRRVGFTGGEPFLALDFLCGVTAEAVKEGFLFDRIMTNAVWYENKSHLTDSLTQLFRSGYDGEICVSVDAFHGQDLKKVAHFIRTAILIWNRADIISIAYVAGSKERETASMLRNLGGYLSAYREGNLRGYKGFIKTVKIALSPIGKARRLKDPWDGRWFKEDYCRGPGNIFFVMPSGDIKPCCGYANGLSLFTIGNIRKDSPERLLKNFYKNRILYAIFDLGLAGIRKRLERLGIIFPGKTGNHCYFCHHILTKVPRRTLLKCVDRSNS